MALRSRRFKEVTATVLCVASAARGGYELERGAPIGPEIATIFLVWAAAYAWLTGRWLPLRLRGLRPSVDEDHAVQPPRPPPRRDAPLESILSWGLWALFLALVLWIASGA